MVQPRGDRAHLIIDEGLAGTSLDLAAESIRRAKRAMPKHRGGDGDDGCRREDSGLLLAPERDQPRDRPDQEAGGERRPEIAPQDVHTVSRASSRQPMSRRWKPSAKSIWSTAR
jgi:hypothetical protein